MVTYLCTGYDVIGECSVPTVLLAECVENMEGVGLSQLDLSIVRGETHIMLHSVCVCISHNANIHIDSTQIHQRCNRLKPYYYTLAPFTNELLIISQQLLLYHHA